MPPNKRQFRTTLQPTSAGGFELNLPFDSDEAWGAKPVHHIAGTLSGVKVRGPLSLDNGTYRLKVGKAWRHDCPFAPGDEVSLVLWPEGPQADGLPEDLTAALEAEPAVFAFWQSLATFYRKAYLTWINGASRRPALREERLHQLVALLKAGKKQRER